MREIRGGRRHPTWNTKAPPTSAPRAAEILGLNYGYLTPLTTLIAQTACGIVLGTFLPA